MNLTENKDANHTIVNAVIAGASIYYNFTGKTSCLNLDSGDDIGADMWDYQVGKIGNCLFSLAVCGKIY
jgi:hypothetical protein